MAEVTLSMVVNLDLVKMKWKEQYVSEGLNRKVAPGQPAGIYQGLRIIENLGANLQVEISPDADTGYHMAVYQSTTGYSLTYWDLAGTAIILNLNDPDLLNGDVVIGLEMDYTVGVDTVAEWKAFPVADWNALPLSRKNEIIVLGTVAVPAAGTITTAMISFERTTMAWRNLSKGALSWSQIIRNGDFEQSGDGTDRSWYWELGAFAIGGSGTVLVSTSDPQRNTRALEFSTLTAGSMVLVASQNVGIPVTPGQLGMFKYQKKNLVVPSSGAMNFDLVFSNAVGSNGANTLSTTIDTSVVDGSYEEVVVMFEVPVGVTALGQIQIGGGPTYASAPVDVLRIDDVSVWLETTGERNDLQHGVAGDVVANGKLQVRTPGAGYSGNAAHLSYDSGATKLEINDLDNSGGLIVDVNGAIVTDDLTATGVSLIEMPIGPVWKDSTGNPAERVDQRLDSIVNDISGNAGAAKMGVTAGSTPMIVAGESVQQTLEAIETNMVVSTSATLMLEAARDFGMAIYGGGAAWTYTEIALDVVGWFGPASSKVLFIPISLPDPCTLTGCRIVGAGTATVRLIAMGSGRDTLGTATGSLTGLGQAISGLTVSVNGFTRRYAIEVYTGGATCEIKSGLFTYTRDLS